MVVCTGIVQMSESSSVTVGVGLAQDVAALAIPGKSGLGSNEISSSQLLALDPHWLMNPGKVTDP